MEAELIDNDDKKYTEEPPASAGDSRNYMMTRGKRLCYRDLIKDGNQTKKDGQELSGASIKLKPDPEEASKIV